MMKFSSENLCRVFAQEDKYENFRGLASGLIRGNDLYEYDSEGVEKRISKTQANKAIQKVFMEVLHLSEDDLKSRRKRRYAEKKYGLDLFEIISEDIDFYIDRGFHETEWFNDLVESRNVALGDATEYDVEDPTLFIVSTVSGDNHDITIQNLPAGKHFTVPVSSHAVKIGKDIDLVVLGRVDYTGMIEKIAESFVHDTQALAFNAIEDGVKALPSGNTFIKTGALSASTKDSFDELLENVSVANNSDVVIVGTKTALKKISGFYAGSVDWISEEQKNSVATLGRLGSYEGTTLIEIPQRYKVGTAFEKLYDNTKLYILPRTADRFIKYTEEGETEIYEVTEKGDLQDDFQTYEVQRRYGVGVALGRYFGQWTIE